MPGLLSCCTQALHSSRAAVDIKKPLWLVHFFNTYTRPDGTKTSACIYKFHHAMADGFAMMRVIFSEVQFEGEEVKVYTCAIAICLMDYVLQAWVHIVLQSFFQSIPGCMKVAVKEPSPMTQFQCFDKSPHCHAGSRPVQASEQARQAQEGRHPQGINDELVWFCGLICAPPTNAYVTLRHFSLPGSCTSLFGLPYA